MSKEPENPNAFPSPDTYHPNGQVEYGAPGMSLRDWFAGQALAGLLADSNTSGTYKEFADYAYQYADVMLRARQKSPSP